MGREGRRELAWSGSMGVDLMGDGLMKLGGRVEGRGREQRGKWVGWDRIREGGSRGEERKRGMGVESG